jgi:predicted phage terminase large subunit-like protein
VDEIVHGKFLPDKLVKAVIAAYLRHNKPMCPVHKIKIEETGFVRGLMVSFRRYQDQNRVYLPFEMIKRDNNVSKKERIINTLQPWYKSGDLVFLDDIACKDHLLMELEQFPLAETDDILDSVADLFQGKTWFGREVEGSIVGNPNSPEAQAFHRTRVQQAFQRGQEMQFAQILGFTETPTDDVNPSNYTW